MILMATLYAFGRHLAEIRFKNPSIHNNTWDTYGKKNSSAESAEVITKEQKAVLFAKKNGGPSELFSFLPLFMEK